MALTAGFGRFAAVFQFWGQTCALAPGLPGDYLRIAYYRLTLDECARESRIQFGSFFAQAQARVGEGVYIGPYCVLGRARIGARTQIASGVQILSGRQQHSRTAGGQLLGSDESSFEAIAVGADCWIGAAAIIMAEVGDGTTIGAGSVVVQPVPSRSVAVGAPARVIKPANPDA